MAEVIVEFDNPYGVFVPGYEVTGTVIICAHEAVKANAVLISVHGEAHTHWTEQEPRTRMVSRTDANGHSHMHSETYYVSIPYTGSSPYVNGKAVIWAPPGGESTGYIQPGNYRFPFKFLLPANCPVSFEGTYGYIRYYCKARIDRPWYKMDKTTRRVFSVIPPSDLNYIQTANLPVEISQSKDTGILFFKNGKIHVTVKLPKRGFVPGEGIQLEATIVNTSSQKIKTIRTKIVQCSHYIAYRGSQIVDPGQMAPSTAFHGPHRKEDQREVWRSEEKVEIAKGATERIARLITIPAVVASFNNCPIITVEYFLRMKLVTSGAMSTNVAAQLPLIIGTIPIRQVMVMAPSSMPQPPPLYPQIPGSTPPPPPPSYAECVLGAGKMTDEDENDAFTPRYPIYPNVTPSAPPVEKM